MQNVAHAMLFPPETRPHLDAKRPTGIAKKNIRATWKFILERVVCQGGPFPGTPKTDKLENLANV